MIVLDASAVLTLVQGEPGEQRVRQALDEQPVLSAATLAEVLGKGADRGLEVEDQEALLAALGIRVETVTAEDARLSARLRALDATGGAPVLSLSDRLCLALAWRLDVVVLTADRVWDELELPVLVELLR